MVRFPATLVAATTASLLLAPVQVRAHGYLLLPETEMATHESLRNWYAYAVPASVVPPESDYWFDEEQIAKNFMVNYLNGNWSSLKQFILENEVPTDNPDVPPGGTAECGFSITDATPKPLPDHLEYGDYSKKIIHPGPCEVWCDDAVAVPFTEDCRVFDGVDIPYDIAACQGKSRMTFYWLATHGPPFQAYISCVPLEGATPTDTPAETTEAPAADITEAPPATEAPTETPEASTEAPSAEPEGDDAAPEATPDGADAVTDSPEMPDASSDSSNESKDTHMCRRKN